MRERDLAADFFSDEGAGVNSSFLLPDRDKRAGVDSLLRGVRVDINANFKESG